MSGKGEVVSVKHPEKGPDGKDIFIDFGMIGPANAKGALVLISGTHGPELFAGSGPQAALLNSGLIGDYDDLHVVLVHGHNPYGSAWMRRTDHKNIDDTNKPGQVEQRLSTLDWLITLFDPSLSARYME